MAPRRTSVIGHHLIWTLYGHWLPNDLRGSGSTHLANDKLAPLGPVHTGRKPEHLQPSREDIRTFYRQAVPLLDFRPFWIDGAKQRMIADGVRGVVKMKPYTVWACAILSNHMHIVVRRHRDDAVDIWNGIAAAVRTKLMAFDDVGPEHPVWAARPYKVFLRTALDVQTRVTYVANNPQKEGLPRQRYDFVTPYDGWPYR